MNARRPDVRVYGTVEKGGRPVSAAATPSVASPAFPALSLPGEIYEGADTVYRQLEKLSSDKRKGLREAIPPLEM
jgi:hypothetical protein